MNWMSILGLCLIVLGTVFSFFGTFFSDKKGQQELTTKIQEKNQTIDEINSSNIKLVAAIEERNKRIQILEDGINNIKEYSYYATLDIYGRNMNVGNGLSLKSDLSNRMEKVVTVVNEKIFVKNDKANLVIIDEVIEKYPNFPFGYFAKYNILKAFNDSEWRTYAKKAVAIFEITTTIKGHHETHDEALGFLRRDLAANK